MTFFFIRADATNEAVYELVAEPIPEPQAGEPQAEATAEPDPEDLVNPAEHNPNLSIQCLFKYLCI